MKIIPSEFHLTRTQGIQIELFWPGLSQPTFSYLCAIRYLHIYNTIRRAASSCVRQRSPSMWF